MPVLYLQFLWLFRFDLSPQFRLDEFVTQCPSNLTGADFYALCSDAMLHSVKRRIHSLEAGKVGFIVCVLVCFENCLRAYARARASVFVCVCVRCCVRACVLCACVRVVCARAMCKCACVLCGQTFWWIVRILEQRPLFVLLSRQD